MKKAIFCSTKLLWQLMQHINNNHKFSLNKNWNLSLSASQETEEYR